MKPDQPPFCPTIGFYQGQPIWKTWEFWRDGGAIAICFVLLAVNVVGWSAMFQEPPVASKIQLADAPHPEKSLKGKAKK